MWLFVHSTLCLFVYFSFCYYSSFRESRKRKSFCEPIVYENSNEKTRGVMTLTEYNKVDIRKQKEEELNQLGLDQDEVELKMIDSGLVAKVLYSCNHCSMCSNIRVNGLIG